MAQLKITVGNVIIEITTENDNVEIKNNEVQMFNDLPNIENGIEIDSEQSQEENKEDNPANIMEDDDLFASIGSSITFRNE